MKIIEQRNSPYPVKPRFARLHWSGDFGRYVLMRSISFGLLFLLIGCSNPNAANRPEDSTPTGTTNPLPKEDLTRPSPSIIEVPRPNSGTYTTEKAAQLLPTVLAKSTGINPQNELVVGWKNPTHGFRVHVDSENNITVHDYFGKEATGMDGLNAALELSTAMLHGNPLSVLLTADADGWNTETNRKIIEKLFQPSIQLYVMVGT